MKLTIPLLLLLASFTGPSAIGAEPEKEFIATFGDDGTMELDGEPYRDRGPVSTYLLAEVEKTVPSPDDTVVLFLRPVVFHQPKKDNVSQFDTVAVEGVARPFAYDPSWKMYNAEGIPTDDPMEAFRVLMPAPTEGDARAFDAVWKECEGSFTGNFNGLPCTNRRFLSDDYAAYLKANLIQCVDAAMASVKGLVKLGETKVKKLHLIHNGTNGDDNHSPRSLHKAGRAIDIKVMRVTSNLGNTRDFVFQIASSKPKSAERNFYWGFRKCWHAKQVKRRCPEKNDPGGIGTIGWEDRKHQHHLHVSMPFCPNNRNWFITDDKYDRGGPVKKAAGKRMPASKKKADTKKQ